MSSFSALPLHPELLAAIDKLGWTETTDIQAAAIPPALAGRDVVGHARTGSGKTAAFALPLLQALEPRHRHLQALVLCPTRELAQQVTEAIRALASGMGGIRVLPITGGASQRAQSDALRAGAHVVVATPGRLLAWLDKERLHLDTVRTLVLDEADRMLDMGFEEQVRDILSRAPDDRQTLLFSATWPDAIAAMSADIQTDPTTVGVQTQVDEEDLVQSAITCHFEDKGRVLCELLAARTPTPTLVFAETKAECDEVARLLANQGADALPLHGDLDQRERDEVMVRLRNESTRIVVATNVAARGLDMDELGLVVCLEPSPEPESHIHRVGRTARASSQGEAVTLVAGAREQRRFAAIEAAMDTSIRTTEGPRGTSTDLSAWTAPNRTLVILGGRKDKLRAGDILGALTRDVGLQGGDVGKIVLTDRRAWVAVRGAVAKKAAAGLQRSRIKKKRFRVQLVR